MILTTTIVLLILGLIIIAIFFTGFSEFFIPLLLSGLILWFGSQSSMGKKQPIYTIALALLAFVVGWGIQKLQLVPMQMVETSSLSDANMLPIVIGGLVLLFLFLRGTKRGE